MKKYLFGTFIVITLATLAVRMLDQENTLPPVPNATPEQTQSPQSIAVDFTATFKIVTNGTNRTFTATMYHELSPDAFINADNPDTIHVTKSNTTWGDFFKTLPFKLDNECLVTGTGQTFCTNTSNSLKFYLNGNLDMLALEKVINEGDDLLISYGAD